LAKASLTKSKARVKELGEVFTPPELVEEMLDRLPPDAWHPDRTFLDPSCGTGNFLVAVARRKVRAGSTPLQALRTTFGVDIMADNVAECRQRLLEAVGRPAGGEECVEATVRCADSLTLDWEGAFPEPEPAPRPKRVGGSTKVTSNGLTPTERRKLLSLVRSSQASP
jgi:SAM-dependent methyltransferase